MAVGVLTRNSTSLSCDFSVPRETANFWCECGVARKVGRRRIRLLVDYQLQQCETLPDVPADSSQYVNPATQDKPYRFLVALNCWSDCPGDGIMRFKISRFLDGQFQHPVGHGNETLGPMIQRELLAERAGGTARDK